MMLGMRHHDGAEPVRLRGAKSSECAPAVQRRIFTARRRGVGHAVLATICGFLVFTASSVSSGARAETACAAAPKIAIDIVAIHDPPALHSDVTLQQLREIAEKTQRGGRHQALGYYFGKFGYTIEVRFAPPDAACPDTIAITVTMGLFDRQVEVAKDLPEGDCLYRTAVVHYRRHALADDVVFSHYARIVSRALHATPSRLIAGASPAEGDQIKKNLVSVIEAALSPFTGDRDAAQVAVDTPAEVDRLAHACATNG